MTRVLEYVASGTTTATGIGYASVRGPGHARPMDSAEGVTNHHNAVEELCQNSQLLRQTLDLVPNLVYVYDLRLQRNTYMNLRIEQLLGYTSREVLAFPNGAVLAHLMPFDTFPTSIHAAHQVAQVRITTKRVMADLRRKFPEQQK